VILINDGGLGIQLQVSVVVRSGWNKGKPWWAIYVQLQEMQSLQIVTTTKAKAEELGLTSTTTGAGGSVATVIPLFGYHNRPGTDWMSIKNSATFGPGLVRTCIVEGRCTQLSNALYEGWLEHDLGEPEVEGAVRGRIKFYNMIWKGGAGFIELADGSTISVHWKKLDKSVFALAPEDIVEFTIGDHNGRRQATKVRVIVTPQD
jgi:cold shock CspA family protein